jgi:hypothetical protein
VPDCPRLSLLLGGWRLSGRLLLLLGRVLTGAAGCATELMGRAELDVARLLTQDVLPTGAVIRTRLELATELDLPLLDLPLLLAGLLLGVPELTRPGLGVV